MSNKKEASKVEETTGFVRENYIKSFKLPISLWEENLKFLNTQVEQWLNFQQDYIDSVIEFYDKFPGWNGNPKAANSHFEHLAAFQKYYVSLVTNVSDRFTKETLNLIQKNVEKASLLFDDYLNLFRV